MCREILSRLQLALRSKTGGLSPVLARSVESGERNRSSCTGSAHNPPPDRSSRSPDRRGELAKVRTARAPRRCLSRGALQNRTEYRRSPSRFPDCCHPARPRPRHAPSPRLKAAAQLKGAPEVAPRAHRYSSPSGCSANFAIAASASSAPQLALRGVLCVTASGANRPSCPFAT